MSEFKKTCAFFKKRNNIPGGGVRKRKADSDKSSEDETKIVKKEKKRDLANPLIQRSKNRGRAREEDHSSSEDSEDDLRSAYKSKRTDGREGPSDMGATSTIQFDTEKDRDAQAVFERSLQVNKEMRGKEDDKVYRGMNNYSHFFEKKDTAQGNAASGGVRQGPMRAPDNLRATVRWDYQPDLCKDFKETGFCGFGDSCKFLHDRTDYKLGWQLEMESGKRGGGDDSDENWEIPSDDEHLPFKCFICRESFDDPIVTKCKHYFCEKCALNHFKKSRRCFVCSEDTGGIFTPATELRTRLKNGNSDDSD